MIQTAKLSTSAKGLLRESFYSIPLCQESMQLFSPTTKQARIWPSHLLFTLMKIRRSTSSSISTMMESDMWRMITPILGQQSHRSNKPQRKTRSAQSDWSSETSKLTLSSCSRRPNFLWCVRMDITKIYLKTKIGTSTLCWSRSVASSELQLSKRITSRKCLTTSLSSEMCLQSKQYSNKNYKKRHPF